MLTEQTEKESTMATGARERVTTRIGGEQLTTVFLVGAVLLVAVLVLTSLVSSPVRGIESSDPDQRAMDADTARWVAMAEFYAAQAEAEQRVWDAYQARNTGLAAYYEARQERVMNADAARLTALAQYHRLSAMDADTARWVAMGEFYTAQAEAEQRAVDAYAARLTGQAEHFLGFDVGD
jgi:hypothetical protein